MAEEWTLRGVMISLSFWGCLLLATVGYALATLSPRWVENEQLAARNEEGSTELLQLAEQVERYERYCEQLENCRDVALNDTPVLQTIAVDESLQFQLDRQAIHAETPKPGAAIPTPIVWLSRSAIGRCLLIGTSMGLVVLAFTALIDSPHQRPRRSARKGSRARKPRHGPARYRTSRRTDV